MSSYGALLVLGVFGFLVVLAAAVEAAWGKGDPWERAQNRWFRR